MQVNKQLKLHTLKQKKQTRKVSENSSHNLRKQKSIESQKQKNIQRCKTSNMHYLLTATMRIKSKNKKTSLAYLYWDSKQ